MAEPGFEPRSFSCPSEYCNRRYRGGQIVVVTAALVPAYNYSQIGRGRHNGKHHTSRRKESDVNGRLNVEGTAELMEFQAVSAGTDGSVREPWSLTLNILRAP